MGEIAEIVQASQRVARELTSKPATEKPNYFLIKEEKLEKYNKINLSLNTYEINSRKPQEKDIWFPR
jgi:hypothetical protein